MFSSATLTANSTPVKVAEAIKTNMLTNYAASIYVGGDFDSGTVALYVSPDNGATLYPLKDDSGTAISVTDDEVFFITLGGGQGDSNNANPNLREQIWAEITGAGTPSVTVTVNSNT
jgi:hypothetical protein